MTTTTIFLLPYAGGSCASFNFLITELKKAGRVFPLELPGRGKRVVEKLCTTPAEAIDDYYRQIEEQINEGPFLIYGHSLGALLGFYVAQRLTENGKTPTALIVSGNAGPGTITDRDWHSLPSDQFFAQVKALGGMPPAFFSSQELLDFFEPILRADFRISSELLPVVPEQKVNVPIYAMMGADEDRSDELNNWGKFTSSGLSTRIFPGGHFFIHQAKDQLLEAILRPPIGPAAE
ncbi:MAG: alpha/beta fold hydrolase [Bacteroidota bacterium]